MQRLAFLLVAVAAPLLFTASAHADVNDFVVTNFQADETLTRHDPQGELHIIEHISVDFHDFNHGILRAIPKSYKGHPLQLHVNGIKFSNGEAEQYSTYSDNGNTVLKIGDPDYTVTGPQEYTIDYTLRNVISFYPDHDELYWDVNGDQWQQPFKHVAVTVHIPSDLRQIRMPMCFLSDHESCVINQTADGLRAEATSSESAYQTLTYVAGFKTGYFHPAHWYETLAEYQKPIIEVGLLPLIVGALGFSQWWRRGRDAKGRGTIVPEFTPPDALTPIEVGTLVDFKVDTKDITAMLIDLAVRKYVKIIETKQVKRLRKDTLSYSLELLNADWLGLTSFETTLLRRLFPGQTVGEVLDISTAKYEFSSLPAKLRKDVLGKLTKDGYFLTSPLKGTKLMGGLTVGLFIFIFTVAIFISPLLIVGAVIAMILAWTFVGIMPSRSAKGVAAKEQIEGLKLYLKTAEADRIKMLQSPDAKYAPLSDAPTRTVDLFEKLLPYAMVLGVEKQWAKEFEDIYTQQPDWYSGHWTSFDTGYLIGSLNDGFGSSFATSFSSPSNSGSSGFSGGSSGGGGGGGGGGGW